MKYSTLTTIAKPALWLAVGYAFAGAAQAHDFCVTTSAQLRAALVASSDGGVYQSEFNVISIAKGTYKTTDDGDRFIYVNSTANGAVDLYGGYDATCSTFDPNVTATVLDGNYSTQVLVLRSARGDITLAGFTIQNGDTNQAGGGLAINDAGSALGSVYVYDMIIRNNHTTSTEGGFRLFSRNASREVDFDSSLVTNNSADQGNGAGSIYAKQYSDFRNNTIYLNTTAASGGVGGVSFDCEDSCTIANNIVSQNTNTAMYLNSDAYLIYNDYASLGGQAPLDNIGAMHSTPHFVDAAGGDFHLSSVSSLIGVSTYVYDTYTVDLDGHPLPKTGKTDIGAYQETIFSDGIDRD